MITSPLYDYVHSGSFDKVEHWLRENPQDLNAFITEGYTPLHIACMFGQEDLVRYFLDRYALVNVESDNKQRSTPLHLAVIYRDEDVALRMARMLIDNGAELNAKQAGGETPLHHAVARASVKLVDELVEAGADPLMKDDLKRSAVDLAGDLDGEESRERVRTLLRKAVTSS